MKSRVGLLATLMLFVVALSVGAVNAQEPDSFTLQGSQPNAPTACPPDFAFGCSISGNAINGLVIANSSTNANAAGIYGRISTTGGSATTAGVKGQNSTTSGNGYGVWGIHAGSGIGVYGDSISGGGVAGRSVNGIGVRGLHTATSGTAAGVEGYTNSTSTGPGVMGIHQASSGTGAGVEGRTNSTSPEATGVLGVVNPTSGSNFSAGVRGINNGPLGYGVYGRGYNGLYGVGDNNGNGVSGTATGQYGFGVAGTAPDGKGVHGSSNTGDGVYGASTTGNGVYGTGTPGVSGRADAASARGVVGSAFGASGNGVHGYAAGTNGRGVWGWGANGTGGTGVYAEGYTYGVYSVSPLGTAGYFLGNVTVNGSFSVSNGTKNFRIDHPLNPEDQYLQHAAIESSEVLNQYTGNVLLDANGEAYVELPDWFEAINTDFRYQLTAIGAPGPNLYIAEEIQGNRFKIAGGSGGMKVSWQVTATRNDAYMQDNPFQVEVPKPGDERGTYVYPEGFDQPAERDVTFAEQERTEELRQLHMDSLESPTEMPLP